MSNIYDPPKAQRNLPIDRLRNNRWIVAQSVDQQTALRDRRIVPNREINNEHEICATRY